MLEKIIEKLQSPARPWALPALAVAIILALAIIGDSLNKHLLVGVEARAGLAQPFAQSAQAFSEAAALRDLRQRDLETFREGLPKLTEAKRALYEGGLQLQEEKRLLEKQYEIMTTYLLIDEETRKVHVMRGEQSLESYLVEDVPPAVYGDEIRTQPPIAPVVSKERFAHPERPKAEEVDGQLQWEPPQVGSSQRVNALGEYVIFTRGPLILHGPPAKPDEHEAFAHYCLNLSLSVAKRLYASTYIGTKISLKGDRHLRDK